jgi:DNA primase
MDMQELAESFDLISFLDENSIEYKTSGKNVSRGWVEIKCPFCFDPSFHLGIDRRTNRFNCWVCSEKGNILKLIKNLVEDCSWLRAKRILEEFQTIEIRDEIIKPHQTGNILPREASKNFSESARSYLLSRDFDPFKTILDYNLFYTNNIGDWKFRIIIPVIMNHEIVNFVGADITRKNKEKYKNCPNEKAIIPIKSCLYNFDKIKGNIIIVEGIMDSWRMDINNVADSSIATFGTKVTSEQINLIFKKDIKKAFILFDSVEKDPSSDKDADKLASQLSVKIEVDILKLEKGDPADMNKEEIKELKNMIKGG